MVIVHSATKGLAAMTLAIAHSRGWLDYEERVATYWPEFAQQGKEKITVRQLLAHQAGLFAFDEPVDRSVVADLDRLAIVLARQKPAWEPGTRQAYHALTLGFYEGELMRRVDPRHCSLGQFFQDEIASPLGEDVYIRVPEEIPNARLATLSPPSRLRMLTGFPLRFTFEAMNRHSNIYRALVTNPGAAVYQDEQRVYARNLEVPSGGAVGTARAIAHAYGVFATGGCELGLRPETLDLLAAPAIPPTRGFYDECLKGEVQFSLGFMKPSRVWPFGSATLVRVAWIRGLSWLCRPGRPHRLRVRHESDGNESDRRPSRCGAQKRALFGPRVSGRVFGVRKKGIMTRVKVVITRYPVSTYFGLTFAISWGGALWAIGGSGQMSGPSPTSDPRFPYAVMAMLAGPGVTAVLLTGLVHGRAGLRAFLSRLLRWRVGSRWYAVALLTAPLLWFVTLITLSLTSSTFLPRIVTANEKTGLVLVGLAVASGAGIFEELGWTGFAIPQVRRRYGVFATGLIVGVWWGAWHLLTNVFWVSRLTAGDVPLSIFVPASVIGLLIGYLVAFRILMVWVYDYTRSLLLAIVMHASLTASVLILDPSALTGVALLGYSFALAVVVWAAVAAIAVTPEYRGVHRGSFVNAPVRPI